MRHRPPGIPLAAIAIVIAAVATITAACDAATPSPSPTAAVVRASPTSSPSPSPSTAPPSTTPEPTATASPTPTPTATPQPTAKVTATRKVRHFKVYGDSPRKLLDSTVARSESHCGTEDTLACVRQSRDIGWTEATDPETGRCRIKEATVRLKSTVWLPRWVKPSDPPDGLGPWWSAMLSHFTWHEDQHIAIEGRYERKLGTLMIGKACSSARKIIRKWTKSVDRAQSKFDAKDADWDYPPYHP